MKKTLLALAAIAASSAAFAQSSVTLYGVVDVSVESVRADNTVTRVSSSNLSSSRIGFKGSEDLGGGARANFMLESPITVDTGAAGSGNFWDRQAWVGLSGGFGELRLGRTDTPIGDIAGNVLSAQAYDDLKIVGTRGGDSYRRAHNAITYILPTLVPGMAVQLQYSTATGAGATAGTEVAGSDEGKTFGLSVKYVAGPLSAGIGYLNAKDETAGATVEDKANATLVYAGYDFGVAKLTAYYDAESKQTNDKKRMTVAGAKLAVPFTPEFTLIVGGSKATNTQGRTASTDNAIITTVKGVYNLSKRTSVYGMFTNVNNDTGTTLGVVAPTVADRTTRALAVGVRHTF